MTSRPTPIRFRMVFVFDIKPPPEISRIIVRTNSAYNTAFSLWICCDTIRQMKSSNLDWIKLILGSAIALGTIVRCAPTLMAGFPLNDGGMFLDMIRDLRVSEYILPYTTSYNFSNIPYAYPPLGFY